jgi:hypothetical protein
MSAFICSDNHIATIARGLLDSKFSQSNCILLANSLGDKAKELGYEWMAAPKALLLANMLSVNARYANKTIITKEELNISGTAKTVSGLEMINLINCLSYQISEFDTLDNSKEAQYAKFVCDVLDQYKNAIMRFLTKDLAWAID